MSIQWVKWETLYLEIVIFFICQIAIFNHLQEERRRQMAAAAEKRVQQEESRGMKDPEGIIIIDFCLLISI